MTLIKLSPVYMTCGKSNINPTPKTQWSRLLAAGDVVVKGGGGQDVDLQVGVNNLSMSDAQVFIGTAVNVVNMVEILICLMSFIANKRNFQTQFSVIIPYVVYKAAKALKSCLTPI